MTRLRSLRDGVRCPARFVRVDRSSVFLVIPFDRRLHAGIATASTLAPDAPACAGHALRGAQPTTITQAPLSPGTNIFGFRYSS